MGISPTKTWNKGEDIRKTGKKYLYTLWLYDAGPIYTLFSDVAAKPLKKLFFKKADKLRELERKHNLNIYIEFVVEIRQNQPPGIFFDPHFFKFVNKIGASIDIDRYVFE